jgi:uncharacterized repeat protein (TIGR02543 family)
MKKLINRGLALLISGLMLLTLLPAPPARAAVTTIDNPILFTVSGSVGAGGAVKYNILVDDIFAQTYQSFTITYPKELSINYPGALSTTWALTPVTTTEPRSLSAIIKSGVTARTATLLKSDLESIYFTLATPDVFPPDGSKVSVKADKEKVTFFQDTEGYVHYYQFVPFAMSGGNPVAGNNPATGVNRNWWQSYNLAHNATMQDPRDPTDPTKKLYGYLATITSEEEQMQLYSAIADWSGWLGGTRQRITTGTARIQDNGAHYYDAASNSEKVRGTAIAEAVGSYSFPNNNTYTWYWADGPEAWTVYNATSVGAVAGGPKYQYYPQGMAAVPTNGWSVYNDATHVYTYWGASDTQPDVANLPAGQSVVADPNRGAAVGPLTFYNASMVNNAAFGSQTDYRPAGVYSNWNNQYGVVHVYNASKELLGTVTGGRTYNTAGAQISTATTVNNGGKEPNGTNSEYCLQFAYASGAIPLTTAANGNLGVSVDKPDTWNDYAAVNTSKLYGYFIEYGGYPGDPKADQLLGSDVGTTSEVEIVMPIIVQYRSTVIDSHDDEENPVYRQVTGVGTQLDRVITYETHLPYTATRNSGSANGITPADIPGYTAYGYQFFGQGADKDKLTVNASGDVSGFHSTNMQRIVFLYQPNRLNVTFNANFPGWSSASVSPGSKFAYFDSPYGALATAIRPGYTLTGWNSGGSAVSPATIVTNGADHTLYANWTVRSGYTVQYNLNGGTSSVAANHTVSWTESGLLPAPPSRDGYIFTGWDVSEGGTKQGVTSDDTYGALANNDAEASITLKAQWMEVSKILVIYHLNGATSPASIPNAEYPIEELINDMLVALPEPTRIGYAFGGWKVVNNGAGVSGGTVEAGQMYKDLAAESAQFIILEAQWTPKQYTIHYNNNDSVGSATASSKAGVLWPQNGLVPPESGEPSRSNFVFMGWNTDRGGAGVSVYNGTPYSQLVSNDGVASVELFAQWQEEPTYQVRYETGGGTPSSIPPKTVHLGGAGLLPDQSLTPPTGYNFSAWSVSGNGTKSGVTNADTFGSLAENPSLGYITLTAQYSPKGGLTVKYNLNGAGGTAPAAKTGVVWTQDTLLPSVDPTNGSNVFVGWNTAADGNGRFVTNADTFGVAAGNDDTKTEITLFAQWAAPATYTVRYDLNGGTSGTITNVTLTALTEIVPAPVPEPPAGYTFTRWAVDDNGYGQSTSSSPDGSSVKYSDLCYGGAGGAATAAKFIILKAVYTERSDFTVIFDPNHGSAATGTLAGVKWTQSGFAPVPGAVTVNLTNPGKNLLGWTTDKDGLNTFVQSSTQYRDLAGGNDTTQVTLYAQWENAHFLVNYDLSGGFAASAEDTEDFKSRTVGFDDVNLLPAAVPKRTGYQLSGWTVSWNGSKDGAVTQSDSFRTLADPGVTYITLQVQWVAKTYTVNYDTNGSTDNPSIAPLFPVRWAQDNLLPALPLTRTGYTFVDWKLSAQEDFSSAPQDVNSGTKYSDLALRAADGYDFENITLQAQWLMKSQYEVNYNLNYTGAPSFPDRENVKWTDTVWPETPPTRAGWTLTGWKLGSADGNAVAPTDLYSALVDGDDTTPEIFLFAQWEAKTYTVKYLPGGVTIASLDENGNEAGIYDAYWWENYPTGSGENKGNKETSIPDYTGITWDAVDTNPDYDVVNNPSHSVVIPPRWLYIDAVGYHFAGWKLIYNGATDVSSSYVIPGQNPNPFSFFAADDNVAYITITGTWAKSYAVFYDLNGGNYSGDTGSETDYFENLTDPVVTLSEPSRSGFTFAGWKLTMLEAATVDGAVYADDVLIGDYRTLAAISVDDVAPNVTLTAQWAEKDNVTITYAAKTRSSDKTTPQDDGWGGYISSPSGGSQSVAPSTGVASASAVINPGYNFVGWFDADDALYDHNLDMVREFYPERVGTLNVAGSYVALFEENPDANITYTPVTLGETIGTAGGGLTRADESVHPATGTASGSTVETVNPGYTFIGWYAQQGAGHNYLGDTAITTDEAFIPAKNVDNLNFTGGYVAVFAENANAIISYGALTYTNAGALTETAGGSVNPTGESVAPATGSVAGATAAANAGYTFIGWFARQNAGYDYLNNTALTGGLTLTPARVGTLNVTGNYVAVFKENPNVTISYATKTRGSDGTTPQANGAGGSVSPGSQSAAPATGVASATASVSGGYHLVGWYAAGDTSYSTRLSTELTFSPARDGGLNVAGSYVALFEENGDVAITYAAVTAGSEIGTTGGTVSSSGELTAPSTGTVLGSTATAEVADGYELVGWFYFGVDYETAEPITTDAAFVPAKSGGLNVPGVYAAYFRLKVYGGVVTVKKDGAVWNDGGQPVITVKKDDAGEAISDLGTLIIGNYMIYADGVSTGITLTVDSAVHSATLNYYTVEYDVADAGSADGSAVVSATYDAAPIASGDIVPGGGDLVITTAGAGAYKGTYAYLWSGAGTNGETASQLTVTALGNQVTALCTVTGTNHYTFSIIVIDDGEEPLESAAVEITQSGKLVDSGATGSDGIFVPGNLPSGYYNAIVTYTDGGREITVSKLIHITDDGEKIIQLDINTGSGSHGSEFNQVDTVPTVAAGDLDDVYSAAPAKEDTLGVTVADKVIYGDGGRVWIRLVAEEVNLSDQQAQHDGIEVLYTDDEKVFGFELDLSAYKDVTPTDSSDTETTQLEELNSLVDICIYLPDADQERTGYAVYRWHDGNAERLPQYPVKNSAGEYFVLSADGTTIILTVKKFSIYTVAYDDALPRTNPVIVTLDANGGEIGEETIDVIELTAGELLALPIPTRGGYTFLYWSSEEDGSGNVYPTEVNIFFEKDVTLYAQWEKLNDYTPRTDPDPPKPTLNKQDHFAYIVGYPDGNVRPGGLITRAETATILFRLLEDDARSESITKYNSFSDSGSGQWFNTAVSTLAKLGIIKGYPDGSVRPDSNITRAEFVAMVSRFFDASTGGSMPYSDVPSGHWASGYIVSAYNAGIILGYPDGTFRPENPISRAEAITIINRLLDRHVAAEEELLPDMVTWRDNADPGVWYYYDIQEATNSHDYVRETDGANENWVAILPNRDWGQIENP